MKAGVEPWQPMERVPDFLIRHDHKAGTSVRMRAGEDALSILIEAGDKGATTPEIAVLMYGNKDKPTVDRVRKSLKKHYDGDVVREEKGSRSGEFGPTPSRWFAVMR